MPLLLANHARPILLAPYCDSEANPDWLGNTELRDCESAEQRDLRFDANNLHAYSETYRAHFDLWRLEARRHGIPSRELQPACRWLNPSARKESQLLQWN